MSERLPITVFELPVLLAHISPEDRDIWIRVGQGIKAEFGEAGFDAWNTWSEAGSSYKLADAKSSWRSFKHGAVTFGSVVHLAAQAGWKPEKKELSAEDKKRLNAEADARRKSRQAEIEADEAKLARMNLVVASACQRIVAEFCKPVGVSEYLDRKQVGPHGITFLRQKLLLCVDDQAERADIWTGSGIREFFADLPKPQPDHLRFVTFPADSLVIPLRDMDGFLWSMQIIQNSGEKLFPKYGRKSGCFYVLGGLADREDGQGAIAFSEGFATGASVREGMINTTPVVFALDSGNLAKVAKAFRVRYRSNPFYICGDDDRDKANNPGRASALEAASACRGLARFPAFPEGVAGKDWNDLHVACGLDAVKNQLLLSGNGTLEPSHSHPDGVLISTPDASIDVPEETASDTRFGRYSLTDLLLNFSLVYGTDTVWDGLNRIQMRLSALRHIVGRELYKSWDEHQARRIARALVFEPSGDMPPDCINLFDRLPLAPTHTQGGEGCQKILEHVWRLCKYREDEYFWLLNWIAYPLQNPGAKMDTSVIMYGSEGPGKSILWEKIVGAIYGRYAITVGQAQLESQFTGWQGGKLLAVCEEVVSRTERSQHKGQLKHLVTGRTLQINEKNLPLREESNHLNFVFLSNSTVPLELDLGDRRFMVLFCGEVPPLGYFDELFKEISAGGIEAFYGHLLSLDLSKFGPHTKPPMNDEKSFLIEASLPSPVLFLREWEAGVLELPYCSCAKSALFDQYRRWCERTNEFKRRDRDFAGELRRYLVETRVDLRLPSVNDTRKTVRIWVTPKDAEVMGEDGYIERLEASCRKFQAEADMLSRNFSRDVAA